MTSTRKETDTCKIYSGVAEGVTTGTPIMISVPNTDLRAHDYNELSLAYRPSHADATYDMKYGGGGRSSERETIGQVASGAITKKLPKEFCRTEVLAYVSQAHLVVLPENLVDQESVTLEQCPDADYAVKMIAAIDATRVTGDSVGGVISCLVRNAPRGLGSPVFDKLEALLAGGLLSIPATMGFEFGSRFAGTRLMGSHHNDEFYLDHGRIRTRTNHSGGIQGRISNGEIINMRAAFKPTPTIGRKQHTLTRDKKETDLTTHIQFDPCVAPRAVPVIEAMVALVLVYQLMSQYAPCYLLPVNPQLQEPIVPPQTWKNDRVMQHA
ncbi:hypothetical protein BT93_A1705 [Corymbia citriodora subsp. variegata]|nr:hypothetical protein BT93_A1705 [Corymbia citriodora subsp. variegata]